MRTFLITLTLILILLIGMVSAQSSMVCGMGVLLKNDGSVMIDGWKLFPGILTAPGPFLPGNPPPQNPQLKDGPSRVTLGLTIIDETPICWETNDGSKCTTMKSIRGLAK